MFRNKVAGERLKSKDPIRWRGHEVTRIEAFSDAVIAFSITLLIVSLEVPRSFDELLESLKQFIPFAISFTLVFQVWMTQNIFFRRFGLHDDTTIMLNGALVFVILFFVYPLKFLFGGWLSGGFSFKSEHQVQQLFYIYGTGFAAIYFLFAMMYLRALSLRTDLQLTESEIFNTRTTVYRNLIMCGIGLLSALIASFGPQFCPFAGMSFILIGPALAFTHARRGKIHRKRYEEPVQSNEEKTGQ